MRNAGFKYACEDSNWLRRQQQEGAALSYSAGPIDYARTPSFLSRCSRPNVPQSCRITSPLLSHAASRLSLHPRSLTPTIQIVYKHRLKACRSSKHL